MLSTHSSEVPSWRLPSSKSKRPAATIQSPTSTSAIRNASPPAARRGSGSSATTSAPATGSRISVVASTGLAHRHEDDDEDEDGERDRERVRAQETRLDAREPA